MKSFLQQLVLVSSLVVLVTACGKDSKGGSKTAAPVAPVYVQPLYDQGFSGQQAIADLQAWLVAPEALNVVSGVYKKNDVNLSGFSFTGSFCLFNCQSKLWPSCFIRNTDGSYALGSTSNGMCTNLQPTVLKANNTQLAAAISGENQTLVLVNAVKNNNVYYLEYKVANSLNSNNLIRYTIDTAVPAAINPVEIRDPRINKATYIEIGSMQ